jgi:hypothetical protein
MTLCGLQADADVSERHVSFLKLITFSIVTLCNVQADDVSGKHVSSETYDLVDCTTV